MNFFTFSLQIFLPQLFVKYINLMENQKEQKVEQQQQKNPIIAFLQSDATLNIAIVLSLIGLATMCVFVYLLEGMARVHLSIVTFLFAGLFFSLIYFKQLKGVPNQAEVEKSNQKVEDKKIINQGEGDKKEN